MSCRNRKAVEITAPVQVNEFEDGRQSSGRQDDTYVRGSSQGMAGGEG